MKLYHSHAHRLRQTPIEPIIFGMKKSYLFLLMCVFSGCTGWDLPSPAQMWPYTMVSGGAQAGRDQLANRSLVASNIVSVKNKNKNEILTLLGQPQKVKIISRNVSEDWYFIYYKRYKTAPSTEEGSFFIRFYNDKVIDQKLIQ